MALSVRHFLGYRPGADDYAYAHDIYPVPLTRVSALLPVIRAIQTIDKALARQITEPLHQMRLAVRAEFGGAVAAQDTIGYVRSLPEPFANVVHTIADSLRQLGGALLARTTSGLPLFLVPKDRQALRQVLRLRQIQVQIRYARNEGWWIESDERRLLNFDLPREVFETHDDAGMFRSEEAIQFKEEQLAELQSIYAPPGKPPRLVVLKLSSDWVDQVRKGFRNRRPSTEVGDR